MKKFLALITLTLVVSTTLYCQTPMTYHTVLFGKLDPLPNQGGRYSALWGYTAPNGREYALLGGYTGTIIIDITDKPIKQVAFIAGPHSGWREMKTAGNYAYVVSEGGEGLQIIDLSQLPASATLVKSDSSVFRTGHTISANGKFIFVNGSNTSAGANGGTLMFDIANPTSPALVGKYSQHYVHDAIIRNDTMYAAEINNGQLSIVYIGDKANPRIIAEIKYPGAGTHNSDLTVDGSYLMTTDEIGTTPKTLKIWDVRDRNNIAKVADFTPVPGQIVHNVHTKGRLAVVAWYSAGTRIIDISNPLDPAEVGYYDTYPDAVADYVGNWETYPYFPSGKIISSDMQSGLHVFTFDGTQRGNVHGAVRDSATGQPIRNTTITIAKLGKTIATDSLGRYNYSGAVDTLDFSASAPNYDPKTATVILTPSGSTRDILLPALPLSNLSIRAIDAKSNQPLPSFAYRVFERQTEQGRTAANPKVLALPRDSSYNICVGAWGYVSQYVSVINAGQTVEVKLLAGYMDDAELDFGWALGDPRDSATTGQWERGVPVETSTMNGAGATEIIQPGQDHTAGLGNYAFITGITGSDGGVGANDVDNGNVTLTSPAFDLTTYIDAHVNCWLWYSRDGNPQAIDDTLQVLISSDDGATWKILARITDSPQQWKQLDYRVKDFVPPTSKMLFRIVASDVGKGSLVEAGLDDFAVMEKGGADVPGAAPTADARGIAIRMLPQPVARNQAATLAVTLPSTDRNVRIELFDALGNSVAMLHDGAMPSGTTLLPVDASKLPPGLYLCQLRTSSGTIVSRSFFR